VTVSDAAPPVHEKLKARHAADIERIFEVARASHRTDKLTVEAKVLADLKVEKAAVEGDRRRPSTPDIAIYQLLIEGLPDSRTNKYAPD
jgi:hypothetical protein